MTFAPINSGLAKSGQVLLLVLLLLSAGCGCTGNKKASKNSDAQIPRSDAKTALPDTKGDLLGSYANVVSVAILGESGARRFSVSVESADEGCERYANWWELLREDGSLVYRRILGHSHTDANGTTDVDAPGNTFTRSSNGNVDVRDDENLFVRAHISDVGYVGEVMSGSMNSGFSLVRTLGGDFAQGGETLAPHWLRL